MALAKVISVVDAADLRRIEQSRGMLRVGRLLVEVAIDLVKDPNLFVASAALHLDHDHRSVGRPTPVVLHSSLLT